MWAKFNPSTINVASVSGGSFAHVGKMISWVTVCVKWNAISMIRRCARAEAARRCITGTASIAKATADALRPIVDVVSDPSAPTNHRTERFAVDDAGSVVLPDLSGAHGLTHIPALPALERRQRPDSLDRPLLGEPQLVEALQVEPKFRTRAEEMAEAQGGIAGNGALPIGGSR